MTQWVEKEPELVTCDAYTNELTLNPGHSNSLTLKGSSSSSNSSKPQFLPLQEQSWLAKEAEFVYAFLREWISENN